MSPGIELAGTAALSEFMESPESSPIIVEQLAIEATNSLRGAEVGIRALRSRPLLRRVWDGVTGKGAELHAAVDADLLTVQRNTLGLVREVMTEHVRTRYCVSVVMNNLSALNATTGMIVEKVLAVEDEAGRRIREVELALREEVRELAQGTAREISRLDQRIDREGGMRRASELYAAGELYSGAGKLLASALYLAQVDRMCASDPATLRSAERNTALAKVRASLDGRARRLDVLLFEVAQGIDTAYLEPAAFLFESVHGPLADPLRALAERRMAQLPSDMQHAQDALTIASRLRDSGGMLRRNILTESEFAERLAKHFSYSGTSPNG